MTTTSVDTLPPVTATEVTTLTTAAATTTTAAPIDPAALLGSALEAYAAGYEFTATTTVNDQVATVQSGRWLGGASQLTVESGDGVVEYVLTADGQWARLPGAEWQQLEGDPVTDNPLTPWATPESLAVTNGDAATTVVAARYPATTVGLTGDPIDVTLTFTGETLSEIAYTTEVDGNRQTTQTIFAPLTDATPITTPTG